MRGIQAAGPAGTCLLAHFDIVHGGSLNLSDRTRNMAKFVFARCSEPTSATWNNHNCEWNTPEDHLSPVENTVVWRRQWDWMSGRHAVAMQTQKSPGGPVQDPNSLQNKIDYVNQVGRIASSEAVSTLIDMFNDVEAVRQAAIYNVALAGSRAVKPLCALLEAAHPTIMAGTRGRLQWRMHPTLTGCNRFAGL